MSDLLAEPGDNIEDVLLRDALSERYLAYALSTIMSRSLPDVRDGLKPVHRRLLYAMRQLRLDPEGGFKKSARVVGDVIGKFHPHGDQAIYDALVRLAQDFSLRYPLIDGQGNFGNIDGDNAAAMRYTEARLTEVAQALLAGIDEDAVDFRPTYDGEAEEPIVLPAAFPNLLANGAQGIAVGMATSIPPHNAGEICDALLHMIRHPNARIDTLIDLMPGPDFPTGGVLVEDRATIAEAYAIGKGALRVRARWHKEEIKGGGYRIVVTEVPFQVAKSRLVERIADLLNARKLALLGDVRDESTDRVRLVLEPKSRNVDPEVLMASLFRQTELESRVTLNMNVLDADHTPRVMTLPEILQAFLDHRHNVLLRRTRHRLDEIARRLEVLDGYLVAYLNLDEVIRIIREEDEPKQHLMRTFDLNDRQAEAILNMRLRALRKLEEMEIRKEHAELTEEQADLKNLMDDPARRWRVVGHEIQQIRNWQRAGRGRRAARGGDRARAGNRPVLLQGLDPHDERPPDGGLGRPLQGGRPAALRPARGDHGQAAAFRHQRALLHPGRGQASRRQGLRRAGAPDDRPAEGGRPRQPPRPQAGTQTAGRGQRRPRLPRQRGRRRGADDHVAVVGENRKLLVFPLEDIPEMARGRGVILQRYRDGGLSDLKVFHIAEGLSWQAGAGRTRTEHDLAPWLGKRGQAGRMPPNGFPKTNKFG